MATATLLIGDSDPPTNRFGSGWLSFVAAATAAMLLAAGNFIDAGSVR
jgi:hypothetical protein